MDDERIVAGVFDVNLSPSLNFFNVIDEIILSFDNNCQTQRDVISFANEALTFIIATVPFLLITQDWFALRGKY